MTNASAHAPTRVIQASFLLVQWITLVQAGDARAKVELVVQPEVLHPGEAFFLRVKVTNIGREDLLIPKPTPANVLISARLLRPDGREERPRHHWDFMEGDPSVRTAYVAIRPEAGIAYDIDVSQRQGYYPKAPGRYRLEVGLPVYEGARLSAERQLQVVEPKDIVVRKTWQVVFGEGSLRGETGRVELISLKNDWFLFYRRLSGHGEEVIARLIEVTEACDFLAVLSANRINLVVRTNESTLGFLSVQPIDGRVLRKIVPLQE